MLRATKQFILVLAIVATLSVIVILAAGISQLAETAGMYYPRLEPIVLWGLSAAFILLLLWPVVLYFRFPAPLVPPTDPDATEHAAYLAELKTRLKRNPLLADLPIESDDDLRTALDHLSKRADEATEEAATRVFLGTAMLQNGRLDGIVVLASQVHLVWSIADIYYQRPSPRHMAYLYANVGVTAFLAAELDDIDFAEMVQPVVYSTMAGVPGVAAFSSVLIDSLSSGAANAFLTLRVGAVARLYCEVTTSPRRGAVRRSATASAAKHLGRILKENVSRVVSAVASSAKDTAGKSFNKIVTGTKSLGSSVKNRWFGDEPDEQAEAADAPEPGVEPSE